MINPMEWLSLSVSGLSAIEMVRVGDLEQDAEFMHNGDRLVVVHKQPNPHVAPKVAPAHNPGCEFYMQAWT